MWSSEFFGSPSEHGAVPRTPNKGHGSEFRIVICETSGLQRIGRSDWPLLLRSENSPTTCPTVLSPLQAQHTVLTPCFLVWDDLDSGYRRHRLLIIN